MATSLCFTIIVQCDPIKIQHLIIMRVLTQVCISNNNNNNN